VLEPNGSDFGEEEEDVKPSIEYLNSLNEYHKRSRSTDDVGIPTSASGKKVARMDPPVAPPAPPSSVPKEPHIEVDKQTQPDDPIVTGKHLSSLLVLVR
jgi:transcription initiation factor TFIIE subunit alpha